MAHETDPEDGDDRGREGQGQGQADPGPDADGPAVEGGELDEGAVVDALGRLGLSAYEARVFIALQKLGNGTASDVAEATDVPRSQVYGAAESLAEHGLVEVQQSSPLRYRPVGPGEAEARLEARLARERERAFDYLEAVQGSLRDDGERRAEIWTVEGPENVADRVATLAERAEGTVLFATRHPDLLDDRLAAALADRAAAGVAVVVASAEPAVLDRAPDGVRAVPAPTELDAGERGTRVLVVDHETVLLGVRTADGGETAVWSTGTGLGTVLARLIEGLLGDPADGASGPA